MLDSCEGDDEQVENEDMSDIGKNQSGEHNSAVIDDLMNVKNQWTQNSKNPDYNLITIHAANAGLRAKINPETGSYFIFNSWIHTKIKRKHYKETKENIGYII